VLVLKHVALIVCLAPVPAFAQSVAGDWLLTEDVYGNALHQKLTLKVDGVAVSGTLGRRSIEGTLRGGDIQFAIKTTDTVDTFSGSLSADGIAGTVVHSSTGENPRT